MYCGLCLFHYPSLSYGQLADKTDTQSIVESLRPFRSLPSDDADAHSIAETFHSCLEEFASDVDTQSVVVEMLDEVAAMRSDLTLYMVCPLPFNTPSLISL